MFRDRLRYPGHQGAVARRQQRTRARPGLGRPRSDQRAQRPARAGHRAVDRAFASATAAALAEAGSTAAPCWALVSPGSSMDWSRSMPRAASCARPLCDTESAAENQRLLDWLGGEQGSLQRLGIVIAPGYTVSKLLWMKEQHPAFARIAHILLPHDYLNYWLTGRCASEYGDASGTGYFARAAMGARHPAPYRCRGSSGGRAARADRVPPAGRPHPARTGCPVSSIRRPWWRAAVATT